MNKPTAFDLTAHGLNVSEVQRGFDIVTEVPGVLSEILNPRPAREWIMSHS